MNIEQIKATLREHIRISEEATPGPWRSESTMVRQLNVSSGDDIRAMSVAGCSGYEQDCKDAAFIASARNLSPVMERVLLGMIELFEMEMQSSYSEDVTRAQCRITQIERLWKEAAK